MSLGNKVGSGRVGSVKRAASIALPAIQCDARELLALLELQELRVRAEKAWGVAGIKRMRTRVDADSASERAYWRAVADGRRK